MITGFPVGQQMSLLAPQQEPSYGSILADLDAEISSLEQGLKSFDWSGARPQLPEMLPRPGLLGLVGAIVGEAGTKGTAEKFVQRVDQIDKFNTIAQMQYLQDQRQEALRALTAKYGIDLDKFRELLSLRKEIQSEGLKTSLGLGRADDITLRMRADEILKSIEDGADIEANLANPETRSILAWAYGMQNPDVDLLRQNLERRQGRASDEFALQRQRVSQGEQRIAQGERRLDLSTAGFQARLAEIGDSRNENVSQSLDSAAEIVQSLATLQKAIAEAKSKTSNMDEDVRLKTLKDQKTATTIRELTIQHTAYMAQLLSRAAQYPQLVRALGLEALYPDILWDQIVPVTSPQMDLPGVPGPGNPVIQQPAPQDSTGSSVNVEDWLNRRVRR